MILVDKEKVVIAGDLKSILSEIMVVILQISKEGANNSSISQEEIIDQIFSQLDAANDIISQEPQMADVFKRIQDELFDIKTGAITSSSAADALRKAMESMTPTPTKDEKKKKKKKNKKKKDKKDSE